MVIKASTILMLLSALQVPAVSGDSPESTVKAFLRAAYTHDAAQFNSLVYPRAAAGVLLSTELVPKERIQTIESEANSLRLRQLQPFRQLGKLVASPPSGVYPDGTTTRYMAPFEGDVSVISVVKKEGRWLVDVRWWLKIREMSLRDEKSKPEEKELVIKKFLLNLLRMNRRAVGESLVPGSNLETVFEGAPGVPEPSDVLPSLVIEMPLIEAEPDEVYPLLSGALVRKGASDDESIMVGLFGPSEMVFHLRRIKAEWRIVPQPYFRILNR